MSTAFSTNLKNLRESKALSMKDVSQGLSIPYPVYSNYEKGSNEPSLENLVSIAAFFNVSVDALLGVSVDRPTGLELITMDVIPVSEMREAIENLESHIRWLTDNYKTACLSTMEKVKKGNYKDMATTIPRKFEELQESYAKIQIFEEQVDLLEHIIKNSKTTIPTPLNAIETEVPEK